MTSDARAARRIVVSGRVQGVGFRYALAGEARRRRLRGWVRNCRDGTVEALVAGDVSEIDALVEWAGRGPPAARVSAVRVDEAVAEALELTDPGATFEIVATV